MFCGHCGAENDDNGQFCVRCGELLTNIPAGGGAAAGEPAGYQAPPPGSIPAPQSSAALPPGQPGAPPGPSYAAYDPRVNTSGMGLGYPLPPEAGNINFGGCIPFGIFAFANNSPTEGALTAVGNFIVGNIANIYLFIKGNELAWRNRRFDSHGQYTETMAAWNRAGIWYMGCSLAAAVLFFIAYFGAIFWVIGQSASEMNSMPGTDSSGYDSGSYSDTATDNGSGTDWSDTGGGGE